MKRNTPLFSLLVMPLAVAATPAAAFDFGFVRVPDYMDQPILILLILSVIFISLMKMMGLTADANGRTRRKAGPLGKVVVAIGSVSFIGLMGLVFIGMGLVRYAEAAG